MAERLRRRRCTKAPVAVSDETLPTARVAALDDTDVDERWLVRSVWSEQAVGFIGGAPKRGKSWLGLDLAVSVACFGPEDSRRVRILWRDPRTG